ncbi:MAG: PKD domain-containing protein [Flavobacteriales bacterium]|jgi:gliding motility-associated-like protein|nr:PKD domain-containing protein [Flavobacteriales bacterium]MCB0759128.1 PKD domain-containing protein [Flavobacteriales bacterium]
MAGSMNELDAFEQQLKESLEQYEVPYNSADWAQMERALSSGVRGWGRGRALLTGLLVAGGLLIGGTAYFLGRDTGNPIAVSGAVSNEQTDTTLPDRSNTSTMPSQASGPAQLPAEAMVEQSIETDMPPVSEQAVTRGQHSDITDRSTPSSTTSKAAITSGAPMTGPGPTAPKSAGTAFRASVKEACPGIPVEFTVEHMPEDGIYLWNFGDGSFSNKPNPQHVFSKPGSYQVMLSMSSAGAGTIHNKPSSDMIVIHDAPSAAFNILKMDYEGQVPTVHFESRALGAKSYHWDLGDGSVSTLAHPDHVYREKGVYQVVQTVTNETGCVDRKVKELRIDRDFDLSAPKSFSPNGDGKEDNFMPQALLDLKVKFQLAVYDPVGSLVYSTSDATRPWCGKVKNQGAVCSAGDYVWVVDVEAANRATETFTGTVKLLP